MAQALHYSHHYAEGKNLIRTFKNNEPQDKAQIPNGQKNWPVLVIMYDSDSARTNIFGISLKHDHFWIRVSAKKEKNDTYCGFMRCDPGDVVECEVSTKPIGLKTSGVPFYHGTIQTIKKFTDVAERLRYLGQYSFRLNVEQLRLHEVVEAAEESRLQSVFVKTKSQIYYIEEGDYVEPVAASTRKSKVWMLVLQYRIDARFYSRAHVNEWIDVAVPLNFKIVVEKTKNRDQVEMSELSITLSSYREIRRLLQMYQDTKRVYDIADTIIAD